MDASITLALNALVSSSAGFARIDILLAERAIFLLPLVLAGLWVWPGATRPGRRRAVVAGFFSLALALVIVAAVDGLHPVYRARPFTLLALNPLLAHPADSSFPSDHTLLGMACVGPLLFLRPRLGIWPVLGVLVIGFARVAAGVHFPSDILGSALLAFALSIVALPVTSGLLDRVAMLRAAVAGSGPSRGAR